MADLSALSLHFHGGLAFVDGEWLFGKSKLLGQRVRIGDELDRDTRRRLHLNLSGFQVRVARRICVDVIAVSDLDRDYRVT